MKAEDLRGMKVSGIVGADYKLHNTHIHSCKFASNCAEVKAARREAMERAAREARYHEQLVVDGYPLDKPISEYIRALIVEE